MSRKDSAGTPATVVLTRAGVPFTTHAYDHDPSARSFGLEAAEVLGLPPDQVFKTLLVDTGQELAVGIVPVNCTLDLPLRTVLDETAVLHDRVYVSGGRRGFDIGLSPTDLLTITQAVLADVAR